jgi:hypothetical protein
MDQLHSATSARNAEFPWDDFNSASYFDHNYRRMREDDAEILELTHSWFAAALTEAVAANGTGVHGLDVGCGPNLYPGLAMLPVCKTLTLLDRSLSNISWLKTHVLDCGEMWRPYWDLISPADSRGGFDDARSWLAERSRILHGSLFDLPEARWDVGTMFFVAESITMDFAEFDVALTRFLRALRPGSPFAAAFMEQSDGYEVGGSRFPSVSLTAREIDACLAHHTAELTMHRIKTRPTPLRPGYAGMILALGRT